MCSLLSTKNTKIGKRKNRMEKTKSTVLINVYVLLLLKQGMETVFYNFVSIRNNHLYHLIILRLYLLYVVPMELST